MVMKAASLARKLVKKVGSRTRRRLSRVRLHQWNGSALGLFGIREFINIRKLWIK